MDLDLGGKHALVCGASEGIGRAAAHELALLGADVTLLARRGEVLQRVAGELPREGTQRHDWIAVDMADSAALEARVLELVNTRAVHVLVNNTAGPKGGPVHAATPDEFQEAFRRHLLANHLLVQAVLPGMRAATWGRIANVVSTSVREPIPNLGVSNTIRGAVASWAKTLSRELAPFGITVNNVLPGYTETGRIAQLARDRAAATGQSEEAILDGMRRNVPAGRFARPEEIGGVIAFLCSPAAGYINGVSLAVDGGRMQSI
ncbi:MAG TPA: SDR family oxidoreductase [Luteimonas sp.]|nr:SDR family oxidoreductase [Luteimonas sp.]